MRQRFIQDRETGELIPANQYTQAKTHYVMGDLPDYESPVDGRIVHGRKGRREDLKRTGSRPWEGMDTEKKEAARARAYDEAKADAKLHEAAARSWANLSPEKKRALLRGM
jgi:hypothetical protein